MSNYELFQAVTRRDGERLQKIVTPNGPLEKTIGFDINKPDEKCPYCDNGWIDMGNRTVSRCPCQDVKAARRNIAKSGLGEAIKTLTFERFSQTKPWQQQLYTVVQNYLAAFLQGERSWLYIGGQVGCGKTHLCTALCAQLLQNGLPVKYMIWPEEAGKLKANRNNADVLEELLTPLKEIKVLYIDDFLKTPHRGNAPTATEADIKLAFELINARYYRRLATIISCEWPLESLMELDQGTMSRIKEMTGKHLAAVGANKGRNYRIYGEKVMD